MRARIEWDQSTLVRVQSGTYGRMIRLQNGQILCSYEAGAKAWVCQSADNGKTWSKPVLVQAMPYAAAANPELLQLQNGRILLFYNQRPHDKAHPFAIGLCTSEDNGRTWRTKEKFLYEAGKEPKVGCWEPAAIELPTGEIQLFFANEFPYPDNDDQEITRLRSFDQGATWSDPETVSYRAGHRDGMPVPLLLQEERGRPRIVLAIEDSGLAPGSKLQPAIIAVAQAVAQQGKEHNGKERIKLPLIDGASSRRWGALLPALPGHVYAGAPYLRQMPTGETVLSCQSEEGARQKPQMVVYVGDRDARHFTNKSVPFSIAGDVGGLWNSLFIKDARTVTAISATVIDGVPGVWAIDGRLVLPSACMGSGGSGAGVGVAAGGDVP